MKDFILLIEDDPQQSETIKAALERRYGDVQVELVETEADFYTRLSSIPVGGERPRIVVCDVMLPWAFPAPDSPSQPPEVIRGTFREAGLRCWRRFREREDLRGVPWIYFTVLDAKTINLESHSDANTGYAQKAGGIEPLFEKINDIAQTHAGRP